MGWWRKRHEEAGPAMGGRDPFAAVPVVADGVEAREDAQGRVQLRLVAPAKPGLASFVSRRLKLERRIRVNLDEYGSLFWKQIDGRRTLREIEALIRQQTGQDQTESEKATILFTRMLMLRHLVYLKVEEGAGSRPPVSGPRFRVSG